MDDPSGSVPSGSVPLPFNIESLAWVSRVLTQNSSRDDSSFKITAGRGTVQAGSERDQDERRTGKAKERDERTTEEMDPGPTEETNVRPTEEKQTDIRPTEQTDARPAEGTNERTKKALAAIQDVGATNGSGLLVSVAYDQHGNHEVCAGGDVSSSVSAGGQVECYVHTCGIWETHAGFFDEVGNYFDRSGICHGNFQYLDKRKQKELVEKSEKIDALLLELSKLGQRNEHVNRKPIQHGSTECNGIHSGAIKGASDEVAEDGSKGVPYTTAEIARAPVSIILAPELDVTRPGAVFWVATRDEEKARLGNVSLPLSHIRRYEMQDLLGRGAMGHVFRVESARIHGHSDGIAEKAAIEKTLAVKMVRTSQREQLKRCWPEVQLLQDFQSHPEHVICLKDAGVHLGGSSFFMVMELAQTDFRSYLRKRNASSTNPLDLDEIAGSWRKMVETIEILHDRGVLHLDLKPDNFLVVNGVLKLADFGLAYKLDGTGMTHLSKNNPIGTPFYMAPESIFEITRGIRSLHYRKTSDIWSAGIILFEMLYGDTPWHDCARCFHRAGYVMTCPQVKIQFPEHDRFSRTCSQFLHLLYMTQKCLDRNIATRWTTRQILEHFETGCLTDEKTTRQLLSCLRFAPCGDSSFYRLPEDSPYLYSATNSLAGANSDVTIRTETSGIHSLVVPCEKRHQQVSPSSGFVCQSLPLHVDEDANEAKSCLTGSDVALSEPCPQEAQISEVTSFSREKRICTTSDKVSEEWSDDKKDFGSEDEAELDDATLAELLESDFGALTQVSSQRTGLPYSEEEQARTATSGMRCLEIMIIVSIVAVLVGVTIGVVVPREALLPNKWNASSLEVIPSEIISQSGGGDSGQTDNSLHEPALAGPRDENASSADSRVTNDMHAISVLSPSDRIHGASENSHQFLESSETGRAEAGPTAIENQTNASTDATATQDAAALSNSSVESCNPLHQDTGLGHAREPTPDAVGTAIRANDTTIPRIVLIGSSDIARQVIYEKLTGDVNWETSTETLSTSGHVLVEDLLHPEDLVDALARKPLHMLALVVEARISLNDGSNLWDAAKSYLVDKYIEHFEAGGQYVGMLTIVVLMGGPMISPADPLSRKRATAKFRDSWNNSRSERGLSVLPENFKSKAMPKIIFTAKESKSDANRFNTAKMLEDDLLKNALSVPMSVSLGDLQDLARVFGYDFRGFYAKLMQNEHDRLRERYRRWAFKLVQMSQNKESLLEKTGCDCMQEGSQTHRKNIIAAGNSCIQKKVREELARINERRLSPELHLMEPHDSVISWSRDWRGSWAKFDRVPFPMEEEPTHHKVIADDMGRLHDMYGGFVAYVQADDSLICAYDLHWESLTTAP